MSIKFELTYVMCAPYRGHTDIYAITSSAFCKPEAIALAEASLDSKKSADNRFAAGDNSAARR